MMRRMGSSPQADLIELEPQLKERVWGGKRLAELYGMQGGPYGEAWLVYDENKIASGPFAGRVLKDVLPELGEDFLGRKVVERYGYQLPLMIKLIDSADWLSVQVHPDDAYARVHEAHTGYLGKAEAWIVLEAEPGARVIYGLKQSVSREELRAAALDGSILELVNYVPVKKGDVIYVPPGTIHALGPGLFVLEVSQRSDLTYRLYDYGRGRELHLDKALDVDVRAPPELQILACEPGMSLDTLFFNARAFLGDARTKDTVKLATRLDEPGKGWLVAAGAEASIPGVKLGVEPGW